MRFRTWLVAAIGLAALLVLLVAAMLTTASKTHDIYDQLAAINAHHREVDAHLRRLRSDVNLSGIFVRDYLLDVARDRAPEYRQQIAQFRSANTATLGTLRALASQHEQQIQNLETQLQDYWATFEPLFDWTPSEKIFRSTTFLRTEVVPRREAVLAITQDVEELNNANLAEQRDAVARQYSAFTDDVRRLLWQTLLVGLIVAVGVVLRLRVLEQRSEHQRAVAEAAERQMRQLSQRLVATQEDERRNLSRELHDHVGQVLTALRMELGRIERARPTGDARVTGALAESKHLVDQMVRTVRDLALGLRPSMLDDFGLRAALEWHVRDTARRSGLDVELHIDGDIDGLPDQHRTCIYRVIQEAFTNCVKHAQARSITVAIAHERDELAISVIDDGVGFDATRRGSGLGLRGIEERVKELGGAMTLERSAGGGTIMRVVLPDGSSEDQHARLAG